MEIGQIANTFSLKPVDFKVNVFMLENFSDVADFNKIPYERLAYLLSSDVLKVSIPLLCIKSVLF